ncbi:sigma-70 family RNA polymerase sigma factor [Arthrobacter sp. HLT1-21]
MDHLSGRREAQLLKMRNLIRAANRTPSLSREEGVHDAYVAHGAELYRFALRSLGDDGVAQDVVQETFLRAWRARDRYDPSLSSLRVWLFSIARNVVIDHSRAAAARPWQSNVVDLTFTEHTGPVVPDPSDRLLRGWIVEEALRRLGQEHRHALTETYLADRPYAEVAAELGIPVSTLRSRVFYGLKALRIVMEELEMTP